MGRYYIITKCQNIALFFTGVRKIEKPHLHLVSPVPVSVNHYLSYRAIIKNGKPMAMSYKTAKAVEYQKNFAKYVKQEVYNQGWILIPNKEQHFYVDTVCYFDRIDIDASNTFKCLLDSITDTKMIWLDDNVVCERVNRIYYDSKNPRMELDIYPVDYIGIFDNVSQLEKFENNCLDCTRYKRNCSILNKTKQGRIQEEIQDLVCSEFKKNKK